MIKLLREYPQVFPVGVNWLDYDTENKLLFWHNQTHGFIEVFDVAEQETAQQIIYDIELDLHGVFKAVSLHPNQSWLAIGGQNKWLVYDYLLEEIIFEVKDNGPSSGVSFSPDGKEIWRVGTDKPVIDIYSSDDFRLLHTIQTHGDERSFPIQWSADGHWFAYIAQMQGGADICFGNTQSYQLINHWQGNDQPFRLATNFDNVTGITFSPDNKHVIFSDEKIQVYEFPSLQRKYTLGQEGEIVDNWQSDYYTDQLWTPPVVISQEGSLVLCAARSGQVYFWELNTGKLLNSITLDKQTNNFALSSTDNNQLLTASQGNIYLLETVKTPPQVKA